MTDAQFDRLIEAIERHANLMANIHAILAATVLIQKVETISDAGAQATLEFLTQNFIDAAMGGEMKLMPRADLMPGKKA